MTAPERQTRQDAAADALEGLPEPPLGSLLLRVSTLRQQLFLDRVGMPPVWLRLLRLAQERPGISQAALATVSDADGAVITRTMRQLEAAGLVRRQTDPQDRRVQRVWVTPAGEARIGPALDAIRALNAELLAGVSPGDAATAEAVLRAILANLRRLRQP